MKNEYPVLTKAQIASSYDLPYRPARFRDFRIDLTDLVRHRQSHYSPVECQLGGAFEALRWMVGLDIRGPGYSHPIEIARSCDRGVRPSYDAPIAFGADWADSHNGLPGIFDIILLGNRGGPVVKRWRKKHRLFAYQSHTIPLPATASMRGPYYYAGFGESCDLRRDLEALFSFSGDFLFSPNECHPKARWAHEVKLHLETWRASQWEIRAHFSYHGDPGSSWYVEVATQRANEPFHWFVRRGLTQLRNMCGQTPADPK